MSDTSRDAISDRREKVLQMLLLGTTVPFKEGGGAVFPNGYPGIGYRLDQSQFERYHAECGNALTRDTVAKLVSDTRWIFRLSMLGLLLSFAAMNFLATSPYFHSDLDSLLPTITAIVVAVLAVAGLLRLNDRVMAFARHFRSAPKVKRHAYLRERLLGALVSRDNGLLFLHASVIVALGFTALITRVSIMSPRPLLMATLFIVPMALWAAWRSILLLTYWRFRLAHGRAPTREDLEPV